jgi:serine/threonine protein kinase
MMKQILEGLNFMHKTGVLHRDIKPGNLLVNTEDCKITIADYGLGKLITQRVNNDGDLTDMVQTRWYRCPELLMEYCAETYDSKLDLWSAGCVLAEMLRGKVLFESQDEKA